MRRQEHISEGCRDLDTRCRRGVESDIAHMLSPPPPPKKKERKKKKEYIMDNFVVEIFFFFFKLKMTENKLQTHKH